MSENPNEYVLQVIGLNKFYDRTQVLKDVTLSFFAGAKIGVIGANGSGKSTLLRILAGADPDFDGNRIQMNGRSIGYVSQEPNLKPDITVKEALDESVAHVHAITDRYNEICMLMGEADGDQLEKLSAEFDHLQAEIDTNNMWEVDRLLEKAAAALDLPPMDRLCGVLSGGEARRVALCKTLIETPDILLLDEPTNHLDANTTAWLEHHLAEYAGLVIVITHDRYFLDNVVDWMLEVDRGVCRPYKGNYTIYLEAKEKELELSDRQQDKRKKRLHAELEWVRQNSKARGNKNKARLARYDQLVDEQQSLRPETIDLMIPSGPRLGNKVIDLINVNKAYGDQILVKDLSFEMPPGAIIGIIGPNGTGKTTLMKMIIGEEDADSGTIAHGSTIEACFVDQRRAELSDSNSVFEEITDGLEFLPFGAGEIQSRAYVSRFNFKGTNQEQKVGTLSGGQRNRVQLAKMLRVGGNLIILDEPTNDLDLPTTRVLEEAIEHYAGCMLIVSHDRYFLDRICTHILAFEGNGEVEFFYGNYTEYAEWLEERNTAAGKSKDSKSGKYRKLGL
ncbi:MAG: energy-dependent translational throttle protein EttA [Planctomycetes bacterium]|nr:energy-dependent translational throttle protein EttA [Planctomycetota bacterium]MCP4771793.1 energy-dependent translational throttle protein EttA [Planctomycetota bacterium]MCP4860964.1 energy-dependent translational throttle protein EttA [Planctomycetota bacterium]